MTDSALNFDPIPRLQQISADIEASGESTFDSPTTAAHYIRCAIKEIERLRAERDEARREVCGLLVACHTDPDDDKPDPNLKHIHAGIRGWDCFKENTDE
jgi:hypothetical protein